MKRKLIAMLAVFAALSLAACNGGNNASPSQSKPAASSQKPSSSKEKWGEWTVVTPATCGAEGKRERVSDAGNKQEEAIPKLKQHTWADDGDVAASNGGVAYKKVKCSVCQAKGLMISTAESTHTGTPKSAPEGCIKLGKDGDTFEVKFNLEEAVTGVLYQRGRMDYWYESSNNNQEKGYYDQNNGHTDTSTGVGNFKVEIGLEGAMTEVSIADKTAFKFADALPEEGGIDFGDHKWSALGDCEIGAVSLSAGLNTIKYTRVDSYNLAVHDFVIVLAA